MKRLIYLLWVALIVLTVGASAIHAQESTDVPGSTTTTSQPTATIVDASIENVSVVGEILLALLAGAVGGLIADLLTLNGNIEIPHRTTADEATTPYNNAVVGNLVDLGTFARVIIGSVAALAALFVLAPLSLIQLLAGAAIAGSAGTSVFASLQTQLQSGITQAKLVTAQDAAQQASDTLSEAADLLSTFTPQTVGAESDALPTVDPNIEQAKAKLNEVKGMLSSVTK